LTRRAVPGDVAAQTWESACRPKAAFRFFSRVVPMPRSVFLVLAAATSVGLMSTEANARVCDYRPSELVRSGASSTVVSGALDTAAGVTEGIFTLTNTATGASLLGANTGAAGALGQISGAASAIGSAAVGVVTAPAAAVAGAVAAVGLGAYEGLCFFGTSGSPITTRFWR
jgi:hypothetical protein